MRQSLLAARSTPADILTSDPSAAPDRRRLSRVRRAVEAERYLNQLKWSIALDRLIDNVERQLSPMHLANA